MRKSIFWRLACLLLLSSGFVHGADGWARLKLGMNADETTAVIGEPLFRSAGKGFELWIYDHHAEVLFFGSLIGWTTPGTDQAAGRAVDVWQAGPGGASALKFLSALPPRSPDRNAARRRNAVADGHDRLPFYRFRR